MAFIPENNPEDRLWLDLLADHPDLEDGLEELTKDPEAGVVTAVGIFTMLKLRFWRHFPASVSDIRQETHQSDNSLPPGAAGS